MHIAIDAHMVGERETGNETYILNLVRALLELPMAPDSDQETFYSLLTTRPERLHAALADLPPRVQVVPVRPANPLLRIPLVLPWLAARQRFDLLHVTYNAPPWKPCPTVITVHDISFEHYPEFFSPRDLLILKTLVPVSIRRAARVITVSQHAKNEIVARYAVPAQRVAVTYEAAGEQFKPITDRSVEAAVRGKYGIGSGPFVLALGNLQPRKNVHRLVQAFAALPASIVSHQEQGLRLVIAGQARWRDSEIYRAVTRAGQEHRVVFPGYVDAADLPGLYSAATVFVYPSLYEGFGLPPLEAMACGTPVICSTAASLPEVVGDAALSVDPLDVEALGQALVAVLSNPGLVADLQRRGLERAARFSWQRCAEETLAVYRAAVQERSG